jgi:2-polyprenyl-3-methyl-5-hydroxy-6-metoxy-1,4-benzoquinol methylase
MPIGSLSELPIVVIQLLTPRANSVLDLGIGMGMYGAAVRQWLDLGYEGSGYKTLIHGVEGFEKYRNPCWQLYDEVTIDDVIDYIPTQAYDAILLNDVIEHFELPDALKVVERMKQHLTQGGKFIVVTPAIDMPQGEVYGNMFERHLSAWTTQMFIDLGFTILNNGAVDFIGCQMITAMYQNK